MFSIKIKSTLLKSFFNKHEITFWKSNTKYDVILEDSEQYFEYEDELNSLEDVLYVLISFAEYQKNGAAFISDIKKNKQKIVDDISEAICELECDSFTFKRNLKPVSEAENDLCDLIHDNLDFYFGHCDWVPEELDYESDEDEYQQLCVKLTTQCIKWLKDNGYKYKDGFLDNDANLELINDFILDFIPRNYPGSTPKNCDFYDDKKDKQCKFTIDNL